jgi:hypothetical protein
VMTMGGASCCIVSAIEVGDKTINMMKFVVI